MLVSLCFFVDDRHLRGIAPGLWQKCANTIQQVTGLEGGLNGYSLVKAAR
jgi:hypothetical protein